MNGTVLFTLHTVVIPQFPFSSICLLEWNCPTVAVNPMSTAFCPSIEIEPILLFKLYTHGELIDIHNSLSAPDAHISY